MLHGKNKKGALHGKDQDILDSTWKGSKHFGPYMKRVKSFWMLHRKDQKCWSIHRKDQTFGTLHGKGQNIYDHNGRVKTFMTLMEGSKHFEP